ncbi:uncharacterized protein LOC111137872 [Crassostrea virginica]|uniref:Uncharacterized protein LOC111137872 n=1 Tax=Crassostrea virginica TaxID=6565 RepID=A0A8B8EYZ3_CRAVI|nr:uncharacterized protein LOC111137872 [Crassostrea virginica]
MAEAEPPDEQAAGQHYLVCGTKDCQQNCQYYCNVCHRLMCERCRDEHSNDPVTKNHEVVFYRQRKRQLPEEKCKLHPTKKLDIRCRECDIPVCSKCCTMQEHQGHHYDDLEEIYAENFALCQIEVSKIQKYFLPTSKDMKEVINDDVVKIKSILDSIRTSMKAEAQSLKSLVDEVTSENIEQTFSIEKTLLEMLESQETTYDEYITYLEKLMKEICKKMANETFDICSSTILEQLKIQNIPETTKPGLPVFSSGHCSKGDVIKLLGNIQLPDTGPEKWRKNPMDITSTPLKCTGQQMGQESKKSDMKQTLSLSSSVTKVREYNVPGVKKACHVSVDKSGGLWASDTNSLVHTDLQRNLLQKIQTSSGFQGFHTATQDGDLIYTNQFNKMIYKITLDRKNTEFIKTGDWNPSSIHSSLINGDILVGMIKEKRRVTFGAKVTRYSKAGLEIQKIKRDNQGQELYDTPNYITENINGDICTSDYKKCAVVVVNKSGEHKFSYTGLGSIFLPLGICTDVLGHILVCDCSSNTVHLLDQDGGFLFDILTLQEGIKYPRAVCMDVENNLYVGQDGTKSVKVYQYLQ